MRACRISLRAPPRSAPSFYSRFWAGHNRQPSGPTLSLSHGHIAFNAVVDPFGYGIFTDVGGPLRKIVRVGDTLDGKVVDFLRMNTDALEGESLVFLADFTDGSQTLYMATVPEPALFALLPLVLACKRRRRIRG